MKSVLIMGYVGNHNFGDQFITDCVEYIFKNSGEYKTEIADFEPSMTVWTKCFYYPLLCISKIRPNSKKSAKILYWAVSIRCRDYFRKMISTSDKIIFGCGSFKYGTQKLWAYYSLVIEIASKLNIPVMFNGMNVQRFNCSDYRCSFLTAHANYSNVKMITSRDGEFGANRLKNDYGIRSDIVCAGVGDPAFWIPECYEMHKNDNADVVGINLIYGKIFQRYGNTLSEKKLLDIYCGVLRELDKVNIRWELFTNGLQTDYKFGEKLIRLYGANNICIKQPYSTKELLDIISSYKVILGARLHACISAYALDIPVVGFYWDEKLVHFSEIAQLEDFFYNEGQISAEKLVNKILYLYKNGYKYDYNNRENWKNLTRTYIIDFLEK